MTEEKITNPWCTVSHIMVTSPPVGWLFFKARAVPNLRRDKSIIRRIINCRIKNAVELKQPDLLIQFILIRGSHRDFYHDVETVRDIFTRINFVPGVLRCLLNASRFLCHQIPRKSRTDEPVAASDLATDGSVSPAAP